MQHLRIISSCLAFYVALSVHTILNYAGRVEGVDEPSMDEAHKKDIELFQSIYTLVQSCVITEDVKTGDCLEMFRGAHPNEPKFDNCKCLIPCVAKKLEVMNTDGTYDFDGIRNITKLIQSDYYRKEVDRVLDICETEPGKDCEGGYHIINCAIQHSHVGARSIRMMMESLDEHYAQSSQKDAPKDDDD